MGHLRYNFEVIPVLIIEIDHYSVLRHRCLEKQLDNILVYMLQCIMRERVMGSKIEIMGAGRGQCADFQPHALWHDFSEMRVRK